MFLNGGYRASSPDEARQAVHPRMHEDAYIYFQTIDNECTKNDCQP